MNAVAPIADEPEAFSGFVYCIVHHERQAAKIGYSADPDRRFRQLQTGSPDMLTLFDRMPGDTALETAFHRYFAERKLMGEWFDDRDHAVTGLFGRMAWEARMQAA
ncbi:GIY-YIG nuclease family protein [Sphingopyxis sp. PET50]|uniref:GIY-YIG nuclease family protein n=1 Tax=Sphingopyxis sp. PET50 TaxID=2976533 RepID=UPI0021AFABBB|nr:GIY-YIG nuclease family protein [Sphingopyxis sp. PET50]